MVNWLIKLNLLTIEVKDPPSSGGIRCLWADSPITVSDGIFGEFFLIFPGQREYKSA
jgi:hypothetical protein